MQEELSSLLKSRRGHFLFESGHHGDLWLDLELLCCQPSRVRPFADELADRISAHSIDVVCGPLNEGAFVALMVAEELNLKFAYSERFENQDSDALYPVKYRVPAPLRGEMRGKRVAIVNDVINAGSAVRGTFSDLLSCEAQVVVIGALLVLGSSAAEYAADKGVILEIVAQLPNNLWLPTECPLCADDVPLEDVLHD